MNESSDKQNINAINSQQFSIANFGLVMYIASILALISLTIILVEIYNTYKKDKMLNPETERISGYVLLEEENTFSNIRDI